MFAFNVFLAISTSLSMLTVSKGGYYRMTKNKPHRHKSKGGAAGKGVLFGIVAAIIIMLLIYFFGNQSVHAETRLELKQYEDDLDTFRNELPTINDDIDAKHVEINTNEKLIDDKKNILREIKQQLQSEWDAIEAIDTAQLNYEHAIQDYQDSRNELFDLLREKSDITKEIKNLISLIQNVKIIPDYDTSKLVKKIGIVNSNVCITMHKAGINSTCPTYKQLILLDTSNTDVSGKFGTDDNGYFHRFDTSVSNNYKFYDLDTQIRLFVDPPREMLSRIKMIELRPNFDTYTDAQNLVQYQEYEYIDVMVNSTFGNTTQTKAIQVLNQTKDFARILYHDRYIDDACKYAIVNADKYELLLADTINLMRNNCDESQTSFINVEYITTNATYQDITTSQKYKDDKRLEYIKEFCIFKFQSCKD